MASPAHLPEKCRGTGVERLLSFLVGTIGTPIITPPPSPSPSPPQGERGLFCLVSSIFPTEILHRPVIPYSTAYTGKAALAPPIHSTGEGYEGGVPIISMVKEQSILPKHSPGDTLRQSLNRKRLFPIFPYANQCYRFDFEVRLRSPSPL